MVLINVRTIAYVRNFDPDHTLVYFAKVNDPLTLVTPVDVFLEALLRALDITKGGSHDSDA